jgi:hypothetical protein
VPKLAPLCGWSPRKEDKWFCTCGYEWNTFDTGGVMPVVGMPTYFRAASPIWQAAETSNHWLFLADHASLHFFSIGDFMLIGGASMFILTKLYQKLARQQ